MRRLGFAALGLVAGAGLALLLTLPQSPMSRAVDTQGLHLIGVLFVAVPVGAVLGAVLGFLVARITRRWGLDGLTATSHGSPMLHLMIPVSFYWTCAT
jgi:hypothetical protein